MTETPYETAFREKCAEITPVIDELAAAIGLKLAVAGGPDHAGGQDVPLQFLVWDPHDWQDYAGNWFGDVVEQFLTIAALEEWLRARVKVAGNIHSPPIAGSA